MKISSRTKKIGFIALITLTALLLTACGTKPDNATKNTPGSLTDRFAVLSPSAVPQTATPEPSKEPIINVPDGTGVPSLPSQMPEQSTSPLNNTGMPIINFHPQSPSAGPLLTSPPPILSAAPKPTASVYKLGSRGDEVKKIQQKLKELKYYKGSVDGVFGKETETALKNFQGRNSLRADGAAGRATLSKLYSAQAKKAATATPRPTATPIVKNNVYLKRGDTGRDVTNMQKRLIQLGYLAGSATGKFDEATEAAVYAFQERNVAYADGIAGPMTLKALYSSNAKRAKNPASGSTGSLRIGLKNSEAVRRMQTRLKTLGYYKGSIDGSFGPSTEEAVKLFQRTNGINVDGVAGPATLTVLNSPRAKRAPTSGGGNVTPLPIKTPIVSYIPVTPAPSGDYIILREGYSGQLVRNLQQSLKDQGFYKGNVDGKYGESTFEAVLKFQKKYGLSEDGIAGPATQRVLFEGKYPEGA